MKASSFSRNAAAAGRAFGYEVHVLLDDDESQQNPASHGFFKQYDTQLHYLSKDKENSLSDAYNHLVKSLKAQGKNVYELHPGGSDPIGR